MKPSGALRTNYRQYGTDDDYPGAPQNQDECQTAHAMARLANLLARWSSGRRKLGQPENSLCEREGGKYTKAPAHQHMPQCE